jgi:hypothetical protein
VRSQGINERDVEAIVVSKKLKLGKERGHDLSDFPVVTEENGAICSLRENFGERNRGRNHLKVRMEISGAKVKDDAHCGE